MGVAFEKQAANVDEHCDLGAWEAVAELSRRKALAVAAHFPGRVVLAADTLVALENRPLGKPEDEEDACRMLERLSGREHQVYTGVCILSAKGQESLFFERTDVTFFPLTQEEIWNYIHEEKPFDKAGSYGIQGKAAVFVEKIQGDFFNVVGFPAARFIRKLRTLEK